MLDANDIDPSHSVERVEVVILGRVRVNNLWIAAVAASRGLPVVTSLRLVALWTYTAVREAAAPRPIVAERNSSKAESIRAVNSSASGSVREHPYTVKFSSLS